MDIKDNLRAKSLDWWSSLSRQEKDKAIERFKNIKNGYRSAWNKIMIERSSSTIELIYLQEKTTV